ncbi:MAG: sigma-54-dependent Fis family transcriptional regulator [Rhodospirillales bacterium 69-11]|nr:sigma-54-dependent Fis family transcriptional regulator [Rhodospirillales bacterium]OJW25609.1 MAG: sigma-54-dependent Fis family transcriptional regulator [Rhodospirillales bacterium 69-11]
MTTILIVDDDAALRAGLAETLSDLGHGTAEAADGAAALEWLRRGRADAVLLDLRMPGLDGMEVLRRIQASPDPPPVAVLTAVPTAANTIEAIRLGAVDHLAKPIGRADLAGLIERLLSAAAASPPGAAGPAAVEDGELVGPSAPMREVQKQLGRLADSNATVLITGETGSGKEVVARALHRHSRRARHPFVAINCAAIPSELLESELFGHVRGAFTGALADRVGSFRQADRGTLFLDEVGDMAPALQSKLLRVLQERVVIPVGGRPVSVDVRVVAATHRDLPRAVREGQFRQDLFYRLSVVPLHLPPLRERLADIVPLAEHFLALAADGTGAVKRLSAEAAARLLAHPWFGNVRELRNAMERVAAVVRSAVVSAEDLAFLCEESASGEPTHWLSGTLPEALARLEAAMIQRALAASRGNRTEAARALGIHRQLLHEKIKRLGIDPER